MIRLGIIPAAGKATRFGGLFKELSIIGEGETLLSRTVDTLEAVPVDTSLVVTSYYKIATHAMALAGRRVKFSIQRSYELDAWGAIIESFDCAADFNYYLMPDTWQTKDTLPKNPKKDFTLGLFETSNPSRFGILSGGQIIDKPNLTGFFDAWGAVVWSKRVVDFWLTQKIESHTHAFNLAMNEFGFDTYRIPSYRDISSFDDYKRLIDHV